MDFNWFVKARTKAHEPRRLNLKKIFMDYIAIAQAYFLENEKATACFIDATGKAGRENEVQGVKVYKSDLEAEVEAEEPKAAADMATEKWLKDNGVAVAQKKVKPAAKKAANKTK